MSSPIERTRELAQGYQRLTSTRDIADALHGALDEHDRLHDRSRLLTEYLRKIASAVGRPTRSPLEHESDIEAVGEGVLDALARAHEEGQDR